MFVLNSQYDDLHWGVFCFHTGPGHRHEGRHVGAYDGSEDGGYVRGSCHALYHDEVYEEEGPCPTVVGE